MLYVILGHVFAYMMDTLMFENYKEMSGGFEGKKGREEKGFVCCTYGAMNWLISYGHLLLSIYG